MRGRFSRHYDRYRTWKGPKTARKTSECAARTVGLGPETSQMPLYKPRMRGIPICAHLPYFPNARIWSRAKGGCRPARRPNAHCLFGARTAPIRPPRGMGRAHVETAMALCTREGGAVCHRNEVREKAASLFPNRYVRSVRIKYGARALYFAGNRNLVAHQVTSGSIQQMGHRGT